MTPVSGDRMDFDAVCDRRNTASLKWETYPEGVLPLWVADLDFPSPPAVQAALASRVAHGVYGYSIVPGSLVDSITAFVSSRYGWQVEPEWFVWLPGVVTGLNVTCNAFSGPGEAVMTVTPVYPPFLEVPRLRGREGQFVPAAFDGSRWRLPLEAMEEAVTPATRVFLFCHPHNPLGRAWEREEVAAVVDFCRRHGLVLCSDEIHCDLLLDEVRHIPAAIADANAADVTITLMAPSKTFNLPGLNFAFAIIPDPELRRRFSAAARGMVPLPGCLAVVAAEAAYRDGGPWLVDLLDYLRANRDLVEGFVRDSLPGVGVTHVEATYLAWLDVRGLGLSEPARTCELAGVALSDGAPFGDPGFLRLNFGCSRQVLHEALRRLDEGLRRANSTDEGGSR